MKRANDHAVLFALAFALTSWSCAPAATTGNGATGGPGGPGAEGGTPSTPGDGSLPCDVDQVLASRCRSCHGATTAYGAPMSLVTYGDLVAPTPLKTSVPVYTTVRARTHDDARPMPPPPYARLDVADQATLDAWIDRGAPKGDGQACSPGTTGGSDASASADGDATTPPPPPDDCVWDTHVAPTAAFAMGNGELYARYAYDPPAGSKRHITQIKVHVDNPRILHHALLLLTGTPAGPTGGIPVADPGANSLFSPMLYAWAPGGNPLITPPEAGFPQDQTTHYMVQIHYNNTANLPNQVDSTGFDLCTTATLRKYDADVVAFGSESINIPPRGSSTTTSCLTVGADFDGKTFFSAFPHMHKLGTTMGTALHSDGGITDMGAIAHWDFSNQPWLPISVTAHSGDVIRASCSWNNPGDVAVGFGLNTTDEMCFSFTAYYPKTPSLGWAIPASTSAACP